MKMSVGTPEELLGVITLQLGFVPEESVIVVQLEGRKMGMLARFDIVDFQELAPFTLTEMSRNGVREVAIFTVSKGLPEEITDEVLTQIAEDAYTEVVFLHHASEIEVPDFRLPGLIDRPPFKNREELVESMKPSKDLIPVNGLETFFLIDKSLTLFEQSLPNDVPPLKETRELLDEWLEMARTTGDALSYSFAGALAYVTGDGARASIAIDLGSESAMSKFVADSLSVAVPPLEFLREFHRVLEGMSDGMLEGPAEEVQA